jgi:hypothetical protein
VTYAVWNAATTAKKLAPAVLMERAIVTLFDDNEFGPAPDAFFATTVNVYDDPAVKPLTTQLLEAVVHDRLEGCDVTT